MMTKPTCAQCSLTHFCFYNDKAGIKPQKRHLKRNETLHRAHDAFTHLYAIEQGALKTHETDPAGHEVIRSLYLKNEVYGYDAIYTRHYVYSSTALTDTIVCEIPYPNFMELIRSQPELLSRILYLMSQQMASGSYLKWTTAQQKLSAFLLDLSTRLSTDTTHPEFLLPLSYQDIGHYLGLATETISRILSGLKKNHIISISKKQVHILQPDALKRMGCTV